MSQLVHDIAPGAKLGFATAFKGQVSFSNNILNLRSQFHADVDRRRRRLQRRADVLGRPDRQGGVDKVVGDGAAYFSSAGNNGLEAYESYLRRGAAGAGAEAGRRRQGESRSRHDGDARRAGQELPQLPQPRRQRQHLAEVHVGLRHRSSSFQWDEPFDLGKVKTDYNIYVFDAAGHYLDPNDPTSPIFFTQDDNTDTDEPAELIAFFAPGEYQLVIGKVNEATRAGSSTSTSTALGESARQNAPSIFGHPAAKGAIAVGARCSTASPASRRTSARPGRSPSCSTQAAAACASRRFAPCRRSPASTAWTRPSSGSISKATALPNFFGTSAAAPDVAGVAALVVQVDGRQRGDRAPTTSTIGCCARRRRCRSPSTARSLGAGRAGRRGRQRRLPWRRQLLERRGAAVHAPDGQAGDDRSDEAGHVLRQSGGCRISGSRSTATHGVDRGGRDRLEERRRSSLILTFAAGKFGAGDFLTFSNVAVPNALPLVSEVDADRVEGGHDHRA